MERDQKNLLRNQFHKAIFAIMSSLDSEEGPVDKEGSNDPVDQEEYCQGPVGLSKKGVGKQMCTSFQNGIRGGARYGIMLAYY